MMGTSTDAILCYGIDFEEDLPKVLQDFRDENDDFDLGNFLAKDIGLEYTEENGVEYFAKVRELEKSCPVELVWHCSYNCPMFIMAIKGTEIKAFRGYPEKIDLEFMNISDERINKAKEWFEKYNIEWQEPKWLLCSMWG